MSTCPIGPPWFKVSARPKPVWEAANQAIELDYHQTNAASGGYILTGRDFTEEKNLVSPGQTNKPEVSLPKGVKDTKFARELLKELRGITKQLRPDIVDFKRRVFYEIKSEDNANQNPNAVRNQLAHYYKLAEAIRVQYGGGVEPPWNQMNATWKPRPWLTLPGFKEAGVCTAATNYSAWPNGLILYDVRARPESQLKPPEKIVGVKVLGAASEFSDLIPQPLALTKLISRYDPEIPILVVCFPRPALDDYRRKVAQERLENIKSALKVTGPFVRRTVGSIRLMRDVGFALLVGAGLAGSVALVVAAFIVVLPEVIAAVAAGGAAATGGAAVAGTAVAAEEAVVVSFATRAAVQVAAEAPELAKAAALIAVVGSIMKPANAKAADDVRVNKTWPAFILPVENFKARDGVPAASSTGNIPGENYTLESLRESAVKQGAFALNSTVIYDQEQYAVIAQLAPIYA